MTNQQQIPDFGDIKVVRTGGGQRPVAPSVVVPQPEQVAAPLPVVMGEPQPQLARKPWLARFWWLPVLALLGIGLAVWGRGYYNARYVGTDFYAQVPATFDMTPQPMRDMAGNVVETNGVANMEVNFVVTGFNAAGEQRQLEFSVRADSPNLPQPGDYVRISASRQLVLRESVVSQSAVPTNILDLIRSH